MILRLDDLGRSEPIEQTNTRIEAFVEMRVGGEYLRYYFLTGLK